MKDGKGTPMNTKLDPNISRRHFLRSTSLVATVGLLAPRHLVAQDDGLVQTARRTAAASNITVQSLRRNVSVLIGAGGNIAVLSGRDGKLLIDAGFAGARPFGIYQKKHPRRRPGSSRHDEDTEILLDPKTILRARR
jgi:hypothetical protein